MKIAFLTSGHLPYDDRIFYHLGMTMSEGGHDVFILSSKAELKEISGKIHIDSFDGMNAGWKEKISLFLERLDACEPDRVICSEPLPVIAAARYRKKKGSLKIFYDITEWYPSGRFLGRYRSGMQWLRFPGLLLANACASFLSDAFIFGEKLKSRPYRLLFPFKPFRIILYFPDLRYADHREPGMPVNKLRLSFSGEISINKGFGHFIRVASGFADRFRNFTVEIRIVGWYISDRDREVCDLLIKNAAGNISFTFTGIQKLPEFSSLICETDIFLDLRTINFENSNSLPIKLFHYMALGRPVIISDLRSLDGEVEINKFGYLADPGDTEGIINHISGYLSNRSLYEEHCRNARNLALEKYNWSRISKEFSDFIAAV